MFENVIALLESAPIFFASLFGLLIGSFLNVVILRMPKRMHHEWTVQSEAWLNRDTPDYKLNNADTPASFSTGGSHCPKCKTPLKPWHNIPVISFLILRGKCAFCKTSISVRYPLIELLTAILSGIAIFYFGITIQGACALVITWSLVALSFIDIDHQLLPDDIVLPMIWLGLLASLLPVFTSPTDAIIGAIAGYMSLWLVFQLFKIATGKEGMGFGDFKLLAMFGAWLGWQYLPQIIILSAFSGSVIGITLIIFKVIKREKPIPFGPYIAAAGWIAMIWGDNINKAYLSTVGL